MNSLTPLSESDLLKLDKTMHTIEAKNKAKQTKKTT